MYKVQQIGYATVIELYEMYDAGVPLSGLKQLKNFQRPWTLKQILLYVDLVKNKVLSIGEGKDTSATMLSEKFGYDVYVLEKYDRDDFLDKSRVIRHENIEEFRRENPAVKYIHGLAGDPNEHKITDSAFDCIYSNSVLEHVAKDNLKDSLADIDRMLKPGGIQVHTIDFPVDYGNRLEFFKNSFMEFVDIGERYKLDGINVEDIKASPMTFYESIEIFKLYWYPGKERKDVKYERWTSLNICLRKLEDE